MLRGDLVLVSSVCFSTVLSAPLPLAMLMLVAWLITLLLLVDTLSERLTLVHELDGVELGGESTLNVPDRRLSSQLLLSPSVSTR